MVWRTVPTGLPADFQIWLQKKALSRNGLTSSFHPGVTFFLVAGDDFLFGKLFQAECSTASKICRINWSAYSQWLESLHLMSVQLCMQDGISISWSFSFSMVLKPFLSSQVAFLQDGFSVTGTGISSSSWMFCWLSTQYIGLWSELLSGEWSTPASTILSVRSSFQKKYIYIYIQENTFFSEAWWTGGIQQAGTLLVRLSHSPNLSFSWG